MLTFFIIVAYYYILFRLFKFTYNSSLYMLSLKENIKATNFYWSLSIVKYITDK